MKGLVVEESLSLEELPVPEPSEGEALIRIGLAGICNTDLEIEMGYMGFRGVLGHEFVGVVEQCDDPLLVGKRVVGEINCVCHRCRYCQMELPNHCQHRTVLGIQNRNGVFAEYATLPTENLYEVPESIPDESAVFVEPLAAAYRILEQVDIDMNTRVVVLGAGKLGQLIAQVMRQETAQVTAIGKNPWKLELLKPYGITTASPDDLIEHGADVVVEATGSYQGFARALELVRPEGAIVLKTTTAHPTAFDLSIPVINEVRVIGSRCGPFRPALQALLDRRIDVDPLISETHSLADGLRAVERAKADDVMKVLVRP